MEFKYKGINKNGKSVTGKILVDNQWNLIKRLENEEIYCIKYKETGKVRIKLINRKISEKNLSAFCRNLKNNLKAGIPLIGALSLIEEHVENKDLSKIIKRIIENIKKGLSFTESLEKHKTVFPEFFITLVRFGEESGKLQQVLEFMDKYYMKEYKRRRKIVSISIYPISIFIGALIMGMLAICKLIPTFLSSINMDNMELPYITKVYMGIGKGLNTIGIFIIPIGMGIFIGINFFYDYLKKKGITYSFKYQNPLMKRLEINRFCCKFTMAMSMMISSGIDIKTSLIILKNCENSDYISNRLNDCIEGIEKGDSLYEGMRKCDIFPKYFLSTIHIGEINGSLEEVLYSCNEVFEEELQGRLDRMTSLAEPLIMIFVGIFIGSIIMAIALPLFSMYNIKF